MVEVRAEKKKKTEQKTHTDNIAQDFSHCCLSHWNQRVKVFWRTHQKHPSKFVQNELI